MTDDMIHSLENMKLTTEEEEVISISDEGRWEEIESCAQSLIGKFLTSKPFNKRAVQGTLKRVWGWRIKSRWWKSGQTSFTSSFKPSLIWKGF